MRHVVTLLSAAALASACDSTKPSTVPPSISLNLDPTTVTAAPGDEVTEELTLTDLGGFDGEADFSVTGAPADVSVTVSNIATPVAGAETGLLTVDVGAAATPGTYPIVVHATATGVPETTATVTLTVTAAPTVSTGP